MAQQDNVALIRKLYTAFASGDVQTILDSVSDNVEWNNYGPSSIPYAGPRSGRDEVKQFFNDIGSSTTGGKVTAESFISQDDTVVSTGRFTATVRGTNAKIDTPVAHVFTVKNGKVTKWVGFSDTAAVAQAHSGAAAAGR